MATLEIFPRDKVMDRFANGLAMVAGKANFIMAVSLNKGCDTARTQVKAALVRQTGLKPSAITQALKTTRASPATLTYKLTARGEPIALKFFSPREVRGGVKHTSPKDPNPYPGGFTRVGGFVYLAKKRDVVFRMGARKATGLFGGHVMKNVAGGAWGGAVEKVMSKVNVADELVQGASRTAFVAAGPKIVDEVGRLLGQILDGNVSITGGGTPEKPARHRISAT